MPLSSRLTVGVQCLQLDENFDAAVALFLSLSLLGTCAFGWSLDIDDLERRAGGMAICELGPQPPDRYFYFAIER